MAKPNHKQKSSCQSSRKRRQADVQLERWAKRRRHKSRQRDHNQTIQMLSYSEDSCSSERCRRRSGSVERVEDVSIYSRNPFSFPTVDVSWWLGKRDESTLLKLPTSMFGACRWCLDKFSKSVEMAKDTVFPSRVYQRELTATQEQLSKLIQEVERLKTEAEQSKRQNVSFSANLMDLSPCQHQTSQIAVSAIFTVLAKTLPTNCRLVNQSQGILLYQMDHSLPLHPTTSSPTSSSPPPLPPSLLSKGPRKLNIVRKKRDNEDKSKSSAPQRVTLQDIQNVKLRKASDTQEKREKAKPSIGGPLVSLSDLQTFRLKRTSNYDAENLNPKMVLRNRISQEALQFRTQLRKVHVARSPGGTPMRRAFRDEGTGLTPVMTRALRKKFQGLRTPSPSNSPTTPPIRN
ncbi:putative proline-rich protein 11 [Apostichopus japonicus]|uniref:Putative proline-rich protein 11 n=1 Tax=Stichopus japonicus TaxID=307972 RepID=A0A2G8LJ46_STIJA|nr:putative proline-rich protein 11 [Apostichopus japonicus]